MLHTTDLVFVLIRSLLYSLLVVAQWGLKLVDILLKLRLDVLKIHIRIIRELLLEKVQERVVFWIFRGLHALIDSFKDLARELNRQVYEVLHLVDAIVRAIYLFRWNKKICSSYLIIHLIIFVFQWFHTDVQILDLIVRQTQLLALALMCLLQPLQLNEHIFILRFHRLLQGRILIEIIILVLILLVVVFIFATLLRLEVLGRFVNPVGSHLGEGAVLLGGRLGARGLPCDF